MRRLLHVTTILSIVLLVLVLISVRRAHIRVEYSVSWLLAAVAMLLLSRSRPVLDYVTRKFGIPDTPLTLFLIAGSVFLIMFFRFSFIISAPARRQHRAGAARRDPRISLAEPRRP